MRPASGRARTGDLVVRSECSGTLRVCLGQGEPHAVGVQVGAVHGSARLLAPRISEAARIDSVEAQLIQQVDHDGLASGAVVIDTGNYYPQQRDGRIDAIEDGTPESVWVAGQLGHPVVKAFNGIYASHLLTEGKPAGSPGRIALPVAGDDPQAKAVVIDLLDQLGFDGVDAGGLEDSWRQQPGTPVYGADLDADGVRRALAQADPARPDAFRADDDVAERRTS